MADELGLDPKGFINGEKLPNWFNFLDNKKTVKDDSLEIKRLQKALKELELEILKKTVHIFSKNDGKPINS